MKTRLISSLLLTLSAQCFAMPITLESDWMSTKYGNGVLTFTYESDTLDQNADPLLGYYSNPLLSLNLAFDSFAYNLDASHGSAISLKAQQMSFGHVRMTGTTIGSDSQTYFMDLQLEVYAMTNSGTDDLSQLEGTLADETFSAMSNSSMRDRLYMRSEFRRVEPQVEVPEPSPIALLFAGVTGLLTFRQSKARYK